MEPTWLRIAVDRDRHLEVLTVGPVDGMPVVFHGGTPTAAVPFPPAVDAIARHAIRVITYSRPGYATSDPQPGRCIADAAADVEAILDAIQADRFVTIGWSGGGPHALACAALLLRPVPRRRDDRRRGALPRARPRLAGRAWAGRTSRSSALRSLAWTHSRPIWPTPARDLAHVTADQVAAALGELVSDVDVASLARLVRRVGGRDVPQVGEHGHRWLAGRRPGLRPAVGIRARGASPPGCDLAGRSGSHGAVRARRVAGRACAAARPHLLAGQGHLSLAFERSTRS